MNDWAGFPFLILWGLIGVFLGLMFATSPELPESMYRRAMNRNSVTKRLADRHAPRERVIKLYRIAGVALTILAVIGLAIGLVGTVGFAAGAWT